MCSGKSDSCTHWVIHFLQLYYSEVIQIPSHLRLPGVHGKSAACGAWWRGCAQSGVSVAEEPWAVLGLGTLRCTLYFILKCLHGVMNYRAASACHCLIQQQPSLTEQEVLMFRRTETPHRAPLAHVRCDTAFRQPFCSPFAALKLDIYAF